MFAFVASTCLANASPEALLVANRTATPTAPSGTLVLNYHYNGEGMEGSASSIVDLSTGAYVDHQQAGLSTNAQGFDGRTPWMEDLSGFHSAQEGGNKPALAVDRAYRNANAWWRPGHGGAVIKRTDCNSIEVTPRGGQAFTARFDPATHLLSEVSERDVFGHVEDTTYADYRSCGTTLVATRIEIETDSDKSATQTFKLDRCAVARTKPRSAFAMPVGQPLDWSLPASGRAAVAMRAHDTHVMIEVRINGKGPFLFYLDSGGHDIISPRLAQELGLVVKGAGRSGGAGEKTVPTGYAEVASIDAGGAVLRKQTVLVLETSPPEVVGELIGGVLGVEFFERFVTSIDYQHDIVTFVAPERFSPAERRAAGTPVSFKFYDHMPQVTGTFDALAARFNIDTGSGQFVTMTRPFAERTNLRSRYPGAATIVDGFGTGGATHSTIVRAKEVTLGRASVAHIPTSLSTASHGAFSDPAYDGNVGNGILSQFRVTFDYPNRTMFLAPVAHPDLSLFGFNRTGVTIVLDHVDLKVVDVAAGTAGAEAGVMPGDIIVSIGGTDVSHQNLRQARQLMKQAPVGQPLALNLLRDGRPKIITLTPRDLVPK